MESFASGENASSSFTSHGTGLLRKKRVLADESPDDEPPEELELSRSLKMNSSCVESHSAVNVHASSRAEPGGEGPTTGEFGRLRCTPLRRATLRRIFLTFGCEICLTTFELSSAGGRCMKGILAHLALRFRRHRTSH